MWVKAKVRNGEEGAERGKREFENLDQNLSFGALFTLDSIRAPLR